MRSDAQKEADLKYRQSEKSKVMKARYAQTEKCKAAARRYRQTDEGKAAKTRHDQSEKGKVTDARAKAKRKRDLDYRPINNWFSKSQGHHIDRKNVLFIPVEIHQSIKHRQDDLESMKAINDVAFEWLCTQEIL